MRSLSSTGAGVEIVERLIRISPCRRGCCEPVDSTHPGTQGKEALIVQAEMDACRDT